MHGETAQFFRNVVLDSFISILIKHIVVYIDNDIPDRMEIVISVVGEVFPPCAGWADVMWIIIKGLVSIFTFQAH